MDPKFVRLLRYVVNGVVATAAHYTALSVLIEGFEMPWAGLANMIAAAFGIGVSFAGNRLFVFRKSNVPILPQVSRFLLLYGVIALVHGAILFVWSDVYGLDYRLGFLVATGVQFTLSYVGNLLLVFK